MIKWIFKWVFRLAILAVVLIVIFLLSYNSILRVIIQNRIREQTGMDAEIGSFKVGLLEPTVEIQNLKIYNTTNFGGTLFLDIPEIHVEYDRAALAKKEIHVTLMRFNLGELDIVKNEAGQTVSFSLGVPLPSKNTVAVSSTASFKKQTGYGFRGIDVLNVSVGKARFIDLTTQKNSREQVIGIEDWILPNVKSATDLASLETLVVLRGNGFFQSLVDQKNSGLDVLKKLGL